MKARLAILVLLMGSVASPAVAQDVSKIFVADRRDELCVSAGGARVVDAARLAQAMVQEAQVPMSLIDRANPQRTADGNITTEELFTAMKMGIKKEQFLGSFKEFGQRGKDADTHLAKITGALQSFLRSGNREEGFIVFKGGAPAPQGAFVSMEEVFTVPPAVEIRCIAIAADTRPTPEPTQFDVAVGGFVEEIQKRLRVRAKVADLWITDPNKIADLDTADLSFNRDAQAGQDTFKIKMVVGWDLGKVFGWGLLPYVKYERTDLSPDDPDVHDVEVLSPGFLATYPLTLGTRFDADVGVSAEATLDLAQRSRLLKLRAFMDPSFSVDIGDRKVQLLGERLRFGRLGLRPILKPIVDFAQVIDRGSNPALADTRTYVGLGAHLGLKVRLLKTPLLEHLLLSTEYWHLQLFGAHLPNAHRLTTSLAYSLTPNISLKFGYDDGNNRDTFQYERYYNLSLGFKY